MMNLNSNDMMGNYTEDTKLIEINSNSIVQSSGMNQMMDENIQRIKEIIKPYEDKIKEQEEIIRKNTFQIVLLKEKLKQKEKKKK